LQKGSAGQLCDALAEVPVPGDLRLHRRPTQLEGNHPKSSEKNGLPDPAQPGDDHRLLRPSTAKALQEDLEAEQLMVTAD
jgi:hypothetical protein